MAGRVRICTLYRQHICDNCVRSRYIFTSSKRTYFKIDTDLGCGWFWVGRSTRVLLPPSLLTLTPLKTQPRTPAVPIHPASQTLQ